MTAYPDTSFLCALYRAQNNTAEAVEYRASIKGALPVTTLVLFEFRQSARFQARLHGKDTAKGYGEKESGSMLADLQSDIEGGLLEIIPVDWSGVISKAESLSGKHTIKNGHRGFDILHVATALELGAKEFLTFDARQIDLAKSAGLKVRP